MCVYGSLHTALHNMDFLEFLLFNLHLQITSCDRQETGKAGYAQLLELVQLDSRPHRVLLYSVTVMKLSPAVQLI